MGPTIGWTQGEPVHASPSSGVNTSSELDAIAAGLLLDPAVRANPHDAYRVLRTEAPVYKAGFGPFWITTGYDDCHTVLRHPDTVQPPTVFDDDPPPDASGASGTGVFGRRSARDADPNVAKSLLRLNPPDHTRLRGLVSRGFTPRRVEQLRPAIAEMTTRVLDDLADAQQGDLLDLVAFPLPVRVIGELVGVPEADRDQFRTLVRDAATSLEPGITDAEMETAAAAGMQMRRYFIDLIADKRAHRGDDLTSALIGVQESQQAEAVNGTGDGTEPLTDVEMIATLILIFAAGFETTTNLIGNGLWSLLRHPGEMQRLRTDPTLAPAAVEEMLRYESPVQLDARRASADIGLGGFTVERGQWIITLLGAANRDPARFVDPEVFSITERDTAVLSFASGIHYCLGASLARMEGQVFFNQLLGRFANIEPRGEPVWRTTLTLRGLETLDVTVS